MPWMPAGCPCDASVETRERDTLKMTFDSMVLQEHCLIVFYVDLSG